MTALNQVKMGKQVKIIEINGGHRLIQRLANMGLYKGSIVIIQNTDGKKMVLRVNETKLVLGYGESLKIMTVDVA